MIRALLTRRLVLTACAALAAAWAVVISPGPAMASPDQFIRDVGGKTMLALGDRNLTHDQREGLVRNLITSHLDLDAVGQFCLGRYSNRLSDSQKQEYNSLFLDYLVKVYAQLLSQYNGEVLEVRDGVKAAGSEQIVDSVINRQSGPPIRVEWKTHDKAGKPLVTDVVVEGVSMAFTQRQQFESVIQNNGGKVDALFAAMRKQISRR
jgi:phospholipid transport system substrate-binding protein